jgi:dienelactone hydrolase
MRSSITVALGLAAASFSAAARPVPKVILTVEPPVALVDAPVTIRVEGLAPREEVALRASTDDAEGRPWRSEAVFRASAKGVVDLSADRPLRGAWTGADAMAPFWSMRPDAGPGARADAPATAQPRAPVQDLLAAPAGTPFPRPPAGSLEVRLEVRAGERLLASAVAVREVTGPRVAVTEVREQGLVGRMYEPGGPPRPAVLVLGGSQGGIPAAYAPVLAGHGYATFALAYFRTDGLPVDLVDVPLERLERGLEWLRARPSVDPGRVAVLGHSRGAEAALLLAATNAQVKAVVALAPSHVVWEGAVRDPAKKGLAALKPERSAWTRAGQPLPFVPKTVTPDLAARVAAGERFHTIEMMRLSSVDLMAVERARIPVETIRGPVLLVSSLSDRMWPAADMADRVTEALRAARFPHRVEHLQYDGLAHAMPDAWLPMVHGGTLGGTAEGTMSAFGRYWPAVLSFLDVSLGGP